MDPGGLFSESWHRVAGRKYAIRPDCRVHRQAWRRQRWYVICDPYTNRFFRVPARAWNFLRQLRADRSLDSVWQQSLQDAPAETPGQEEIVRLVGELGQAGLLVSDQPGRHLPALRHEKRRRSRERGAAFFNFLAWRIPLWDPDRLLQRLQPITAPLLGRWGLLLWGVLIAAGAVSVIGRVDDLQAQGEGLLAVDNLPWLYLAWIAIKLLHELGHGLLCRRFGGEVHTLGVMLLVFTPVPYVDATAAWGFRETWKRVMTGAGGMLFELAIGAAAAVVWAQTYDGFVHQLCYNIMFVSTVATLLFNANPLLRFDGYYMLCDLAHLPNLSQRSLRQLQYVTEKYVFGHPRPVGAAATRREAGWLITYGLLSSAYRAVIAIAIIRYIGGAFLGLGVILAALAGFVWFVLPVVRFARYLGSARFSQRRGRVAGVLGGAALATVLVTAVLPVDDSFTAEGVLTARSYRKVMAPVDGWVRDVAARSGQDVAAEETLFVMENPQRRFHRVRTLAGLDEIRVRMLQAQERSPGYLETLRATEKGKTRELSQIDDDLAQLVVKAPITGRLQLPPAANLNGRFLSKGTPVGSIYDFSAMHFQALIEQAEASRLFEQPVRRVRVRLAGDPTRTVDAEVIAIEPAEKSALPTASLGVAAGGNIPTSPLDPNGVTTREPFFTVTLKLRNDTELPRFHSVRGRVQFTFARTPLLVQVHRKVRQMLLTRPRS